MGTALKIICYTLLSLTNLRNFLRQKLEEEMDFVERFNLFSTLYVRLQENGGFLHLRRTHSVKSFMMMMSHYKLKNSHKAS